jgi:hypothetical protein
MNFQQAGWIQENHVLVANSAANFAWEDKMFKLEFLEKANKANCESLDNCQQIIGIVDVPSIGKTLVILLVLSTVMPFQASAEDGLSYEEQLLFQNSSGSKHRDSSIDSQIVSQIHSQLGSKVKSQVELKSKPVFENPLELDVTFEQKNDKRSLLAFPQGSLMSESYRLDLNKSNVVPGNALAELTGGIAPPEIIVEEEISSVTSANTPIENIDDPSPNLSPKRREALIKADALIPHSLLGNGGRGVRSVSDAQQLNELLYQQVFASSELKFSQTEQSQTEQSQTEPDKRNSQIVDNAPEPVLENPKPEEILEQLENLPNTDIPLPPQDRGYLSSPGITISNPNGYGADNNTIFAVADYQKRTRFTRTSDGELAFGIGLGNAVKFVGAELTYTLNSLGTSQDLGSGAFSIKLHRRIAEDLAVAIGWNQFADVYIGERRVDFDYPKNSYYAVVTKVFKTREFINQPFSRVAVTAGIGSGQFLPFDTIREAVSLGENPTGLNVFASVGVRVFEPVSTIVEWTGQDLGIGLSIVPFKNLPFVISPAFRDITGAGDGARFIMGAGVSLRL